MATTKTKTINNLPAKTTPADTDIAAIGNTGTANMRKVTFANIANYILNKLTSKTYSALTTTAKTLTGAINELKSGSATKDEIAPKQIASITNLSDVPLGSQGYAQFDASVSPTGSTAYFTYWCTGVNDRRSIYAIYTAESKARIFVNVLHDSAVTTWKGWREIPAMVDVDANTAGRLGVLVNANLDDMHTDATCGVYWFNTTSSDITGTKPVDANGGHGLFIVKKQTTVWRQFYVSISNNNLPVAVWRQYDNTNNVWTAWTSNWLQKTITNSPHFSTAGINSATSLTSDTDINQLLTGEYYWVNASTRPGANIPDNTAVRGRIWAIDSGGSDVYCTQICYTSNFNWFIRYCTSRSAYTWTDWRAIPTRAEVDANTAGRIGMIQDPCDLDDYKTDAHCGIYWLNCTIANIANKPTNVAQGLLFVMKQSDKYIRQFYVSVTSTLNTDSKFRYYNATSDTWTTWSDGTWWSRFRPQSYQLVYGGMTGIAENQDLNDMKAAGNYYCGLGTIAVTLANCPVSNAGFSMHVEQFAGGTGAFVFQTLYGRDDADVVQYTRWSDTNGTTWSPWVKMATMNDMSVVVGWKTEKTLTATDDLMALADGHYRLSSAVPVNAPPHLSSTSKYGYVTVQHRGASAYTYYEYVAGNGSVTSVERFYGWKGTNSTKIVWDRSEYTSLACSYGTITYNCYKANRIVALIATIDVTTAIPANSDIVTGLPYTGQTSNYTPIRAFENTSGQYIDLDVHRNGTSSCSLSTRTAIASGASIRINATYATEHCVDAL